MLLKPMPISGVAATMRVRGMFAEEGERGIVRWDGDVVGTGKGSF